jgi:predicted metal-dependent peptidase
MLDNTKDREERRLAKAKISLMRNPKFALWSGIMMVGTTSVSETMPTACTNGRDEVYGREFIKGLSDKELGFVVLHENLHKAFRHLFIWRKLYDEDARLANAACDYVINLMIVKSDPREEVIAMPRKDGKIVGLYDEKYKGMNAKQVFDLLKQECEQDGGGSGEGGFDEHDWDQAKELSDEDKETLEREIDQAIRQGVIAHQKSHGKGQSGFDLEILELTTPQVDWREELREFVKSVCASKDTSSWRRVNRRFLSMDTYMPSLIGESIERISIGVDTSGSINNGDLAAFLSEVKAIADDVKPNKLDLMYWGSSVVGHEMYTRGDLPNIVSSTRPRCGGGTDPSCMSDYLSRENIKPECVVMLTDGDVPNWGENWDAPVLWVVCNQNKLVFADNGKTVHLGAH